MWPTRVCRNSIQSCVAGAQQSRTSLCWEMGGGKSEALEIAKKVNDNLGAGSTPHTGMAERAGGCSQRCPIPVQGAAPPAESSAGCWRAVQAFSTRAGRCWGAAVARRCGCKD